VSLFKQAYSPLGDIKVLLGSLTLRGSEGDPSDIKAELQPPRLIAATEYHQ
jgi:hypothetical protein